jgi:nicotinate-nucleotide pyrophosphorylase (carboxylating)
MEKYAVRCGGGTLHRLGLFDAALYKDNHLAHLRDDELTATLRRAIERARAAIGLRFVEVEVDRREQFERLIQIPAGLIDIVLLDNMPPDALREAVQMRDNRAPHLQLEASGNVTLDTVLAIAETGVDRISVGALTHSVTCLDIGFDIA